MPQVAFFPIIKVSPQFFIKGFSSNTPLIQIICYEPCRVNWPCHAVIVILSSVVKYILNRKLDLISASQNCKENLTPLQTQLKRKRKDRTIRNKGRERGAPHGKEGSIKNPHILTLPPKFPRSGKTFHYVVCTAREE